MHRAPPKSQLSLSISCWENWWSDATAKIVLLPLEKNVIINILYGLNMIDERVKYSVNRNGGFFVQNYYLFLVLASDKKSRSVAKSSTDMAFTGIT